MQHTRLALDELAPTAMRALFALEGVVRHGVDHELYLIVKLRASFLNGCAFCVDMHGTDLIAGGVDARLALAVGVWRESTLFTDAERAALALTDAVTHLGARGVTDEVWDDAVVHHGVDGAGNLLLAIATINVWNRVAVTIRSSTPGLVR